MGNLPSPIRSKLFERFGDKYCKVSVCSCQGFRTNMEDTHVVSMSLPRHPLIHVFAVCDGHNGRGASEFLEANLCPALNELSLKALLAKGSEEVKQALLALDQRFCASKDKEHGSTLVLAIVKPKALEDKSYQFEINVFWAGDSRCCVVRGRDMKDFECVTWDHRPSEAKEEARIKEANGTVINNRVDCRLAVSRAFGDVSLKDDATLAFHKQRVTSLCDSFHFTAHSNDKLFLFCDGLVEQMSNGELIECLRKQMKLYSDPCYALGFLLDEIIDGGSRDNLTACLIEFENGDTYAIGSKARTFLPGPLFHSRHDKKFVRAYLDNALAFGHSDTAQLRIAAFREDIKYARKYGSEHQIAHIEACIHDLQKDSHNVRRYSESGDTEVISDEESSPQTQTQTQTAQRNRKRSSPMTAETSANKKRKLQDGVLPIHTSIVPES